MQTINNKLRGLLIAKNKFHFRLSWKTTRTKNSSFAEACTTLADEDGGLVSFIRRTTQRNAWMRELVVLKMCGSGRHLWRIATINFRLVERRELSSGSVHIIAQLIPSCERNEFVRSLNWVVNLKFQLVDARNNIIIFRHSYQTIWNLYTTDNTHDWLRHTYTRTPGATVFGVAHCSNSFAHCGA